VGTDHKRLPPYTSITIKMLEEDNSRQQWPHSKRRLTVLETAFLLPPNGTFLYIFHTKDFFDYVPPSRLQLPALVEYFKEIVVPGYQ
jgi:hypothetical protein